MNFNVSKAAKINSESRQVFFFARHRIIVKEKIQGRLTTFGTKRNMDGRSLAQQVNISKLTYGRTFPEIISDRSFKLKIVRIDGTEIFHITIRDRQEIRIQL